MLHRTLVTPLAVLAAVFVGCAKSPPATPVPWESVPASTDGEAPEERNRRIEELARSAGTNAVTGRSSEELRIGPGDLLEVTVFAAPELSATARVSEVGDISLPLLGPVRAGGSTPRELESALEERLGQKYMLDPHVTVQVSEIQSRPISVLGAVNRPGVFQVRGTRTLLEVLAMAEGLTEEAGRKVVVVKGRRNARAGENGPGEAAAPASDVGVQHIDLERLLEVGDASQNIAIYPGDIVKVQQAEVVYVVGEVNQPGAFPLTSAQRLTVLQAVALGGGVRSTAAKGSTMIIRSTESGERVEIPIDLGSVLAGRAVDTPLQADDIVFVPNSSGKAVAYGLLNALIRMVTLRAVF